MAQARGEFTHVKGPDHKVIEEILAKGQVVELVVIEQQDDRTTGELAAAQLATEVHGFGEGEGRGVDDRSRETLGGLQGGNLVEASGGRDDRCHARDVARLADRPFARGYAEDDVGHRRGRYRSSS